MQRYRSWLYITGYVISGKTYPSGSSSTVVARVAAAVDRLLGSRDVRLTVWGGWRCVCVSVAGGGQNKCIIIPPLAVKLMMK